MKSRVFLWLRYLQIKKIIQKCKFFYDKLLKKKRIALIKIDSSNKLKRKYYQFKQYC